MTGQSLSDLLPSMTTQDHIDAHLKGQESYDVLLDIARSIRRAMITESEACRGLLYREFPKDGGGYKMAHQSLTAFSDSNNGSVESVSFFNYDVTIKEELYGNEEVWYETETVPLALFTASKGDRFTAIQSIINARYNQRCAELRAAPIKAAAEREAKERAEYERLAAKYGVDKSAGV